MRLTAHVRIVAVVRALQAATKKENPVVTVKPAVTAVFDYDRDFVQQCVDGRADGERQQPPAIAEHADLGRRLAQKRIRTDPRSANLVKPSFGHGHTSQVECRPDGGFIQTALATQRPPPGAGDGAIQRQ